ncbi:MAG: FecR family protein [Betaproteobacteria bacterium]|jgi:hypothetical protein
MNLKTQRLIAWITLATFLPFSVAFAAPAGQFVQSSGYVAVSNAAGETKSVGNGSPVESGQTVTVGDGARAVIKFQDGQIIGLQSKSIFKVNNYQYDQAAPEKGQSYFALLQGGLRAITGLIGNNNKPGWKLATPTATIGIRGTDFLIALKGGTYITVKSGAITGVNFGGSTLVDSGQTALIESGSKVGNLIPLDQLPPGIFSELEALDLSAAIGSSAGAGAAGGTIGGIPTSLILGVGVVGAAAAAAAGGGGGSTTTHH